MAQDCLGIIFEHLGQDNYTLHSCILVNRVWCEVAIPILWKAPFIGTNTYSLKKIIDIYLRFLPWHSRITILNCSQLNLLKTSIYSPRPRFTYPLYLKSIDISILRKAVNFWLEYEQIDIFDTDVDVIILEIGRMIMQQSNLKELTFTSIEGPWISRFVKKTQFGIKKSLVYLHLSRLDFQNSALLPILAQFHTLQSLEIDDCYNLGPTTLYYDLNLGKLHKLIISETIISINDLTSIIQKASQSLYTFYLYGSRTADSSAILQLLGENSPNLRRLAIPIAEPNLSILNAIITGWVQLETFVVHHNFFPKSHEFNNSMNVELKSFAASIPRSLQNLDIRCNWHFTPEDLRNFFEECQANLRTLHFGYCENFMIDHVEVIKNAMKIKSSLKKVYVYPLSISEDLLGLNIVKASYENGFSGPFPCSITNRDRIFTGQ